MSIEKYITHNGVKYGKEKERKDFIKKSLKNV